MKIKNRQMGLIWFGAGVSIAEILTGTYFAPLGFSKGLLAIIIGHIIGGALFFLAGLIGGKTKLSAMETVELSFGKIGCFFFAVLNILQLAGWTAIMIYDGGLATNGVFAAGAGIWSIVIGVLILVWIVVGFENLGWINNVAMSALFILTVIMFGVILKNSSSIASSMGEAMSFGAAVELAVAMPLSWLPLISDYTRDAEEPKKATWIGTIIYGLTSTWMYLIGMSAAIFTGESDIVLIMVKAGLGIAALIILILSTVTTTFLDAYSAGISSESISKKINGKYFAIAVTIIGTVCAVCFPMDDITDFLYLIGSVFAPMVAIQIADFYILKRDRKGSSLDYVNAGLWIFGFILYRIFMKIDMPLGSTIFVMIVTLIVSVTVRKLFMKK